MTGWANDLAPHWAWLTLGLVLAIGEMTIPGVFLIWLAGAAIVVGLLAWAMPIAVPLQIVLFAVLSVVAVFAGRAFLKAHPVEPADPKMNDRMARAVGEVVTVTQSIEAGSGRVKLGDSEWMARGPDAAAGTRMRVSGHEGGSLVVEPLDL